MLKFNKTNFIVILSWGAALSAIIPGETPRWNYKNQEKWEKLCQTGSFQSPINLNTSSSIQYQTIFPLALGNVGYCDRVVVGNNGHTVTVSLDCPNCAKPNISGAGLPGNYILDSIHFHWPSEHTINGKYYDLEAHLVFYNDRHYNLNSALLEPFAVSVVGILFQETKDRNRTAYENFKIIGNAVKKVARRVGQSVSAARRINIKDFFYKDIQKFFTYKGSLTTPPCTENIIWFVMRDASYILGNDLAELSRIYTQEGEQLRRSNRKRQKLNRRAIYIHDSN